MPRLSLEDEFAARVADDPGDDPERRTRLGEHGALLDVHFQEHARKTDTTGAERAAPHASDLLTTKHHHGACADARDDLDRRNDTERAVEATALRNRVEMRADPDVVSRSRPTEEISFAVDLDVEPGFPEPRCCEPMRLVLGHRAVRAVRARPAPDRVELVKPLEDPHLRSLVTAEWTERESPDERHEGGNQEGECPGRP